MPSWGEVLKEISELVKKDGRAYDLVRRKYLASQHALTKRAVILYASKWTEPEGVPPGVLSVNDADIHGFMECLHGIEQEELDLIIHSPGGSPAAAEACVHYLRSKFKHIRVIVPQAAMSAATMIACAADEIVMGKHSFLGPIDPQLIMQTSLGGRAIPARAILDQFEKAKKECKDPANLAVWLPMLQQYGPDLLVSCANVLAMSKEMVGNWLATYMFRADADAREKGDRVAVWLANHDNFKMHGRYIGRDELRAQGLNIVDLEKNKKEQEFVLSAFHATTHTFTSAGAAKIIENHLGKAMIQSVGTVMQAQFAPPGGARQAPPNPAPAIDPAQFKINPPFPKKKQN